MIGGGYVVMINRRGREVIVVIMSVTGRMYMLYF